MLVLCILEELKMGSIEKGFCFGAVLSSLLFSYSSFYQQAESSNYFKFQLSLQEQEIKLLHEEMLRHGWVVLSKE